MMCMEYPNNRHRRSHRMMLLPGKFCRFFANIIVGIRLCIRYVQNSKYGGISGIRVVSVFHLPG